MQFDMTIPIWGIATLLVSFATAAFAWFATRRKDVEARFEQIDRKVEQLRDQSRDQDHRIQSVENDVSRMPGKDDVNELKIQLAALGGALGEIRTSISGQNEILRRVETVVSRHEDHLLEGARK